MKIAIHWITSMLALFLASSCTAPETQPLMNASQPESPVLSIKKLSENRQRLDGQVVRVRGFYYSKPPTSALFPDQDTFEKKDSSLCLWIGPDKPGSKADSAPRKDRAWVIVEGQFKNQSIGTFDQFFAQLEDVTAFSE